MLSRLVLALAGLGIVISMAAGVLMLVAFFTTAALITKLIFWHRHLRSK